MMNRDTRRIIHRTKFAGGMKTPREIHAAAAFPMGSKCHHCGAPPIAKLASFAEEAEMLKRDPALRIHKAAEPEKYAQMRTRFKPGWFLRLNVIYACPACLPEAERAAAKLPSWVYVDIDRGPKDIPIMVGYGS